MSTCKAGRFKGNCEICDDPKSGSSSYREYDVERDSPAFHAWNQWFKNELRITLPLPQIPLRGWVARDVQRKTVTFKVMDWNPGDESGDKFGEHLVCYADRTDDGHLNASKDVRYAAYTVQLSFVPPPFPEVK